MNLLRNILLGEIYINALKKMLADGLWVTFAIP